MLTSAKDIFKEKDKDKLLAYFTANGNKANYKPDQYSVTVNGKQDTLILTHKIANITSDNQRNHYRYLEVVQESPLGNAYYSPFGFKIKTINGIVKLHILETPIFIKEYYGAVNITQIESEHKYNKMVNLAKKKTLTVHQNEASGLNFTVYSTQKYYDLKKEYRDGRRCLNQDSFAKLTFSQQVRFALDICRYLKVIHDNNSVHRDIKPGNVLVGKNGEGILVDYNLSQKINKKVVGICGTPQYLPPEIYIQGYWDKSGDIYSLGLTLGDLLSNGGLTQSRGNFLAELRLRYGDKVAYRKYLLEFNTVSVNTNAIKRNGNINQELNELIIPMLNRNPDGRPSIDKCIQKLEKINENLNRINENLKAKQSKTNKNSKRSVNSSNSSNGSICSTMSEIKSSVPAVLVALKNDLNLGVKELKNCPKIFSDLLKLLNKNDLEVLSDDKILKLLKQTFSRIWYEFEASPRHTKINRSDEHSILITYFERLHKELNKNGINQSKINNNESLDTVIKRIKKIYSLDTTTEKTLCDMFFKKHKETFENQIQSCCFGFFRKTNTKKTMSLSEIIAHGLSGKNRTREVMLDLGWINKQTNHKKTSVSQIIENIATQEKHLNKALSI